MPQALPDDRLRAELAEKSVNELQGILLAMKSELHNKTDLEDRERLIRKIEIEKLNERQKRILIKDLRAKMLLAADNLQFEKQQS